MSNAYFHINVFACLFEKQKNRKLAILLSIYKKKVLDIILYILLFYTLTNTNHMPCFFYSIYSLISIDHYFVYLVLERLVSTVERTSKHRGLAGKRARHSLEANLLRIRH